MDNTTMDELAAIARERGISVVSLMQEKEQAHMNPPRDLSVKEVAAQTNQSPGAVYQSLRQNEFPGAYQIGKAGKTSPWRIPQSAIDAYRKTRATG